MLKALKSKSGSTNQIWNAVQSESRMMYGNMIRDSAQIMCFSTEAYGSSNAWYFHFLEKAVNRNKLWPEGMYLIFMLRK